MEKEINDANLETIIEKVSQKSGLTIANIRNILTLNEDYDVAKYLKVKPSDIDCVFSGESSLLIADLFGLTYAEIQNLIDELGKNFVVGMLFSKIILKDE